MGWSSIHNSILIGAMYVYHFTYCMLCDIPSLPWSSSHPCWRFVLSTHDRIPQRLTCYCIDLRLSSTSSRTVLSDMMQTHMTTSWVVPKRYCRRPEGTRSVDRHDRQSAFLIMVKRPSGAVLIRVQRRFVVRRNEAQAPDLGVMLD